jgi:hypothetical protein
VKSLSNVYSNLYMHPESSASDSEMQAVEAITSNAEDETQDSVTIKIAMNSIPEPPDCTLARHKVLAALEDLLRPDGRIEIAQVSDMFGR